MTAILLLALVGLAAVGAEVLAPLLDIAAYIVWLTLNAMFVVLVCVVGFIGDAVYNRKVAAGKKTYRLPFYYRWRGWQLGGPNSDAAHRYKYGGYYDKKFNRIVTMYRPS